MTIKYSILRHLPYFVAAAEEENFQRAANRLNIAQSAISRRMRELEYEMGGIKLFAPGRRGVHLTDAGRIFLRDARHILAEAEAARSHAIAVDRGMEPRLRVGYSAGILRHGFFESMMWSCFNALAPIVFETELAAPAFILEKIAREQLDIGIIYADQVDESFSSFDVAHEPYQLALPSSDELAVKSDITFDDIRDRKLIWYARGSEPAMHAAILKAYRLHGARPSIIESPTADTTLRWISRGAGLSFLPTNSMEPAVEGVTFRFLPEFELTLSFMVVWLRSNHSEMRQRFTEVAHQMVA